MNKILKIFLFFLSYQVSATDVNIVDFGAKAGLNELNTEAIQKAINQCKDTGGGRVIIPKGQFVSGELRLYSGVVLHLDFESELLASRNLADYPSGHFINALDAKDTGISGVGTINGNGDAFWDKDFKPLKRPEPFMVFTNCNFLKIRDVKIINSPSHVMRIETSKEVVIDRIYIENPERSPNTDGIDIVDSKNVFISNSTIITGDDAICLKSKKGIVENVTVTNCSITSDDGGLKLGTGSKNIIQHCVFSNIVITNTRFALALFMQEGGTYRFISFNNISIQNGGRNANVYPIYIDVDKKVADGKLGKVEFINFSNLQIETRGNILISGQKSAPLEHISLNNITMLVRNCDSLADRKKPRGNRFLPIFEDTKDLSTVNSHITLGFIKALKLTDVQVIDQCEGTKREVYYKENIEEIK